MILDHIPVCVISLRVHPPLMMPQWLRKLAPPTDPYLHNDLHVREAPEGWPGGHAAWVNQEPINAHSHLLSVMIGNSLTVPVSKGKLCLGTWQVRGSFLGCISSVSIRLASALHSAALL